MGEYSLYIIVAYDDDGTVSEYEHGDVFHARQHFDLERHAELHGYKCGKTTLIDTKGV